MLTYAGDATRRFERTVVSVADPLANEQEESRLPVDVRPGCRWPCSLFLAHPGVVEDPNLITAAAPR